MRRKLHAQLAGAPPARSRWTALVVAAAAVMVVATSGCGTGGVAVKKDIWEAQDDFERRQASLSEKVLELEGRIAALEEEESAIRHRLDQLAEELSELDTDFSRGLEAVRDGQQQLGVELESRIRSVDAERQSDRADLLERLRIVVDEVSAENRSLRQEIDALKSAVSVGFTHVVKRGETLASIAARYGVTVQEIAAANDIANPNLIEVGQELFIPQK